MEAKTLHLTLKKKWFDMTLALIKKEEYREIKPYWTKRLMNGILFKEFDTIKFKNGYASDAPEFTIEHLGIEIREGNSQWGAIPCKKYFVLKHGEILSTKNIKQE